MAANLPPHIVGNIKTLNGIPALQNQLKYLGDITQMCFVSILTPHLETWAVCAVYSPVKENISLGTAFQFNNIASNQNLKENIIVVENSDDLQLCNLGKLNPLKIQKAIIAPIHRSNGKFFGLVCGMDTDTTFSSGTEIRKIYDFHSKIIGTSIELAERLDEVQRQLQNERKNAEKNATFIAVLAHDLRNPVGTIRLCSDIILKTEPNLVVSKNATLIRSSSYRMQELIDSVMDTAQGSFGHGIKV